MPPDPTGARPLASAIDTLDPPVATVEPTPDWYDRSSLLGDFMVMIAGQTEAEYFRRAPEGRFCELIDGIVYMPPGVVPDHQSGLQFLLCLILMYHARRPIGVVQSGPTALKLREGCWLEPDLFVLPEASRAGLREDQFGSPPVLLVVEVLSPSTRDHDRKTKAALYREAQVEEIWFVDRPARVVIVERREGGRYGTDQIGAGPVVSGSLPGCWFDAGWLWAEPGPNLLDCLDRILAGPPAG